MSKKNLACEVESIALALSEEGGYEYYHIDDELRELAKDISYMQEENAKLRELCAGLLAGYECGYGELCKGCTWDGLGDSKTFSCLPRAKARDLGVEVDA